MLYENLILQTPPDSKDQLELFKDILLDTTAKQKDQFERCRREMMDNFRGKLEVQKEYGMVLERNLKGLEEQLEKDLESNMQINMNNYHII
jgi:hypothetical protein